LAYFYKMSSQTLKYRLNACPMCLICLKCDKFYGNLCSCEEITMYWSRNIQENKKFRTKSLTQESTKKRIDFEFVHQIWKFSQTS